MAYGQKQKLLIQKIANNKIISHSCAQSDSNTRPSVS